MVLQVTSSGSSSSVLTDDAAFTPGSSSVSVVGALADMTAPDSVDEGDTGALRMSLARELLVQIRDAAGNERGLNVDSNGAIAVTSPPVTSGGLSIFRSIDLDESEEEVKATAGQLYGIWFSNTATATRFLKIYNATAANVTVGTTTPLITLALPGNSADDVSGNLNTGGQGIVFDTAITVAATTGIADNDTGAPSANEVIVNVFYK